MSKSERGVLVQFPDLPEAVVHRRRGRPRTVGTRPSVQQERYEEHLGELRDQHVERDALVRTGVQADPSVVLDEVIAGVAREQAAIAWDARRAERKGSSSSAQILSRRIDGLVRLGGLVLEREHLRRERGGLDPDLVEHIREDFLALTVEAATEVMPLDSAKLFTSRVRDRLDEPKGT